ncbi:hypothetical protein [Okeania sp. SIO3I5]|uniref:hypothetical protein n=1 Tax=Okeania sp. SIO3I5 TaxID=2607805 RepID=UPI003426FAC6
MFLVTRATGGLGCQIIRILTEKEMSVRAFAGLNSTYSELEKRRVGEATIIMNRNYTRRGKDGRTTP